MGNNPGCSDQRLGRKGKKKNPFSQHLRSSIFKHFISSSWKKKTKNGSPVEVIVMEVEQRYSNLQLLVWPPGGTCDASRLASCSVVSQHFRVGCVIFGEATGRHRVVTLQIAALFRLPSLPSSLPVNYAGLRTKTWIPPLFCSL